MFAFSGCRQRITDNLIADEAVTQSVGQQTESAIEEEKETTTQPPEKEKETTTEQITKSDSKILRLAQKKHNNKPNKTENQNNNSEQNNSSDSQNNSDNDTDNNGTNESDNGNGSSGNGNSTGNTGSNSGNENNGGNGNGTGNNGDNGNNNGDNDSSNNQDNDNPSEPAERTEVTVTLKANGGRCSPRNITVFLGEAYKNLPEATRGGYSFEGWYTAADGGEKVTNSTIVTTAETHSLYAHWSTRQSFTVSFDVVDSYKCWIGAQASSRTVFNGQTYGNDFPKPTCRQGYTFVGWFTEKNGGNQVYPNDIVNLSANQTLYAHLNYDADDYWGGILDNASIFSCQIQRIYIEYDKDNVTTSYSTLISRIQSINAARTVSDTNISDDEIKNLHPDIYLKCVSNMGSAASYYNSMSSRFPNKTVYVLPQQAEWGNKSEKIYYALYLGKLLYPSAFTDIDLDEAARDLGVNGQIYSQ